MKFYRNLYLNIVISLILFSGALIPAAGQPSDPQIRLAQVLENNQQYESALELYRNLYQKNPENSEIIGGIKRCCLSLQKYDELIPFYENLIQNHPAHSVWRIDLAEVYHLHDQPQKALELWWAEIKKDPKNIASYRLIAAAMINQRLYNDAISVYNEALRQIEGQSNLYIDIGNLYKHQLEYGRATEQYLNYFNSNPKQKQFLQRQVLSLSDAQNQIPAVIQSLENYLILHPEQNDVRETLAGLFLKEKKYDQAFLIFKNLDRQETQGRYLLNFAAEVFNHHAYAYAIAAHGALQTLYPDSPYKLQSYFEMGRAHFALANEFQENFDIKNAAVEMARAVFIFDSLAANAGKSNLRAASLIYLGDIFFNFYFDLDQALTYYQTYIQTQPASNTREQTILKLGDLYLCKNQIDQARETYRQISSDDCKAAASFKLTEIDYFQGKIKKAQLRLSELIPAIPAGHTLLNDMLSRQLLLQCYAQDSLALITYANCELLIFQRKLSEAAERLSRLAMENKPIGILAGRRSAGLLLQLEKNIAARELLMQLITSYAEDPGKDETMFLLAQTEEKLHNYQQAISWYQQILTGYPTSLFAQRARDNARRIQNQLKKEQS
jgi:tetratricopeptide (TPR) repeat protein